jgi:hypothetical protein
VHSKKGATGHHGGGENRGLELTSTAFWQAIEEFRGLSQSFGRPCKVCSGTGLARDTCANPENRSAGCTRVCTLRNAYSTAEYSQHGHEPFATLFRLRTHDVGLMQRGLGPFLLAEVAELSYKLCVYTCSMRSTRETCYIYVPPKPPIFVHTLAKSCAASCRQYLAENKKQHNIRFIVGQPAVRVRHPVIHIHHSLPRATSVSVTSL